MDEIYLRIAPIILGMGKRCLARSGPRFIFIQLKHPDTLDTSDAQHMRYDLCATRVKHPYRPA
jgi:hypothetical protein